MAETIDTMTAKEPEAGSALALIYRPIDMLLWLVSRIGSVAMVAIVTITVYDVFTRYLGVPKAFGLTSTKLQDAEWWSHTILFSTAIAYAYVRQSHVRIDLLREMLNERGKHVVEILGNLLLLMPFAAVGSYYTFQYAWRSFLDDEGSTSTVGLDNIWIVKFFLLALFVTAGLAAISQLLKSVEGFFASRDNAGEGRGPGAVVTMLLVLVAAVAALFATMPAAQLAEALPLLMFAALAILLFSGFPVAFVLGGVALGVAFAAIQVDPWLFDWPQFNALPQRVYGSIADNLILTALPMFVFMGTMLERSGVARDLLNCLQVLMRRVPGGLAVSVVLMGTILAAATGIIGASVIMMSLLALPVMLRRGYSPMLSTGSIAASGTLGILIPPSIMLVIMADLLSRSVGNLFVAAIIPGIMLSSFYILYIITISTLKPELAPKLDADIGPKTTSGFIGMLLRSFLPPVLLIVMVLGSIIAGIASPTEASAVGAAGAVLLGIVNLVILPALKAPELQFDDDSGVVDTDALRDGETLLGRFWRIFKDVVERAMLTNAMIFGVFIGATLFSYVFRQIGGEDVVLHIFDSLGLGPWGVLISIMVLVFFLGFFFDWIEITLIVLPVFAPIIAGLDFGDHLPKIDVVYWFAILMAINLQTSFLTPPFGFALFYLKAVAPKEVKIQQIYMGIIPFVMLQVLGLCLVMAFPDIAMWLPRVLLD